MSRIQHAIIAGMALILIGVGVWMLSPPVALIVLGGLVWLDITVGGKRNDPR